MIPVMDVQRQYLSLKGELNKAVLSVLNDGQYILGKNVQDFEGNIAGYLGARYAVGVGNGTDALVIALRACGVNRGDEVITTAMSFFATAESIVAVGAIPVFVDCTKDTFLIDVSKIEENISTKTKAIIPVHLYGQCVDMEPLMEIAKKYKLKVIEDAAQACGAEYKGKKAGSIGDVGCISFFPTKNLGAAGDGGMIVTNDEGIFRCCQALRAHGSGLNGLFTYRFEKGEEVDEEGMNFNGNLPKYYNFLIGYNSRLDALQAAVLNVKLPYLDKWNQKRRGIAKAYDERICNPKISKPYIDGNNTPIYYVYTIVTEDREGLKEFLNHHGISSGVYFPVPLHLQVAFEGMGYHKGDMPNAEFVADHTLAIPMFPELTDGEQDKVIEVLNKW